MAEMSDEEALEHMERERASKDRPCHLFYGSLENAYRALKDKVERARAEKPKRPSLNELERRIRTPCPDWKHVDRYGYDLNHAADILRALDEKVVPWLKRLSGGPAAKFVIRDDRLEAGNMPLDSWARQMLRALGEDVA